MIVDIFVLKSLLILDVIILVILYTNWFTFMHVVLRDRQTSFLAMVGPDIRPIFNIRPDTGYPADFKFR